MDEHHTHSFLESIRGMVTLTLLMAVIALGAYAYTSVKSARYMTEMPVIISVTGEGEVVATPDIATIGFSVTAKEADAATAKDKAAETMNSILVYLKEKGIEDKDIKTQSYNLSPRYEYPQSVCSNWGYCPPSGEPKLVGYDVTQSIEVKIRKTDDVGMVLSGLAELGATNVYGPTFTIDDDSTLKAEAREEAIADAKAKAEALADQLGVRIVRMSGYWEEMGPMPYYGYGMGGGDMAVAMESKATPDVPTGENTIISRVNVSYEVR